LGNLHPRRGAIERGDIDLAAHRSRRHRDRHLAEDIGAVPLEELVRLDRQEDVEVAGRAAAQAGLALAGKADARAVLDALGNVDRERALLGDAARAAAGRTRVLDRFAAPLAVGAGALDREKALARPHLAVARARRAGGRLGAGARARARACFTGNAGRHADL